MKKKILALALALTMALSMLPTAALATDTSTKSTITDSAVSLQNAAGDPVIAGYGFAWNGNEPKHSTADVGEEAALSGGGKSGKDWMGQTMWVVLKDIPAGSLWFEVKNGSDIWGCSSGELTASADAKTFAFSFLNNVTNPLQWEYRTKKDVTDSESGITAGESVTLNIYKTDAAITGSQDSNPVEGKEAFFTTDITIPAMDATNKTGKLEVELPTLKVEDAASSTLIAGDLKKASDLQTDVQVNDLKVSGTSKYVEGWEAFSSKEEEQTGNFVALKLTATPTDAKITVTMSDNTTTKEVDDGILIWKITPDASDATTTKQKVTITVGEGDTAKDFEIDLSGLTLEGEKTETAISSVPITLATPTVGDALPDASTTEENVTLATKWVKAEAGQVGEDGAAGDTEAAKAEAGKYNVTITVTPSDGYKLVAAAAADDPSTQADGDAVTATKFTINGEDATAKIDATTGVATLTTEVTVTEAGEKYTVTFVKGDEAAEGTMAAVEVDKAESGDTKYTLPACTFTLANKEFAGWLVDEDTEAKAAGTEITLPGNVTLTATWKNKTTDPTEKTYTIKFAGGEGATGTMDNATQAKFESGATEYTLPECTFTAPEGKEFDAWTVTGEGLSIAEGKLTIADTVAVDTEIILTATWKDAAPTVVDITSVAITLPAVPGDLTGTPTIGETKPTIVTTPADAATVESITWAKAPAASTAAADDPATAGNYVATIVLTPADNHQFKADTEFTATGNGNTTATVKGNVIDEKTGAVTLTVDVAVPTEATAPATVEDGKATDKVDDVQVEKDAPVVIDATKDENGEEINEDPTADNAVKTAEVTMPKAVVDKLADSENGASETTVKTPVGTVTLPADAMKAIADNKKVTDDAPATLVVENTTADDDNDKPTPPESLNLKNPTVHATFEIKVMVGEDDISTDITTANTKFTLSFKMSNLTKKPRMFFVKKSAGVQSMAFLAPFAAGDTLGDEIPASNITYENGVVTAKANKLGEVAVVTETEEPTGETVKVTFNAADGFAVTDVKQKDAEVTNKTGDVYTVNKGTDVGDVTFKVTGTNPVVKIGSEALTAVGGVYTIPAAELTADLTVTITDGTTDPGETTVKATFEENVDKYYAGGLVTLTGLEKDAFYAIQLTRNPGTDNRTSVIRIEKADSDTLKFQAQKNSELTVWKVSGEEPAISEIVPKNQVLKPQVLSPEATPEA